MRDDAITLSMVAHIPVSGVTAFQDYEAAVLPLLSQYNARLVHRYQNADGTFESHIVTFKTDEDFTAFRASEHRAKYAPLLKSSGADIVIHMVDDVA